MRVRRLSLRNYRTFEDLEIKFPDYYTAICGQNDAGKSNVIKALQLLLGVQEPYYRRRSSSDLSLGSDYPKWMIGDKRKICISVELEVFRTYDAGLYTFINEWLELESNDDFLNITLQTSLGENISSPEISVSVGEKVFTALKAEEVNNRLRSTLLIHNSTEAGFRFSLVGELDEFSEEYGKELEDIGKKASTSLKRVAKAHKEEITNLLGRLSRNYKVEITLPDISLNHLPYDLTLGDIQD